MSLQEFIDSYGYLAILLGTFLEGETTLLMGAIAAKLNYLELPWVMLWAFIGSVAGDQLFFLLGRFHGAALLKRYPSWQQRAAKAETLLHKQRIAIIFGCRFLYGLRIITPFVIGMSRIPVLEFVLLNLGGAALWAVLVGTLGYAFGHAMELLLGDIRRYELELLGAVLFIGALIWLVHLGKTRSANRHR